MPICDLSTVVALAARVGERGKWNVIVLVQEHLELPDRDPQVVLIELVRDVESDRPELLALHNNRVEEGQREQELPELIVLGGSVKEVALADRVKQIRPQKTGLEPLWRLIRHLHGLLQNGNREEWGWVGGQPQPEVFVHLPGNEPLLADGLESWQETLCEVAVLQDYPEPVLDALLNPLHGHGALALTKRDGLHLDLLLFRKSQKVGHWIRTWRENEEQGRVRIGFLEAWLQIERNRRDKLLAHNVRHVVCHSRDDLVRPEAPQNEELLEMGQLLLPLARESLCRRIRGVVDGLPQIWVIGDVFFEALVVTESGETTHFVPHFRGDPAGGGILVGVLSNGHTTSQQESQLAAIDRTLCHLKLGSQQEGKEELVLLKEGPANVQIEEVSEVVRQDFEPLVQIFTLFTVRNGSDEQGHKPSKGVLVHRINVRQVCDAEEKNRAMLCDGLVTLSCLINLGLCLVGNLLLLGNIIRSHLCLLQNFHRSLVFENVTLTCAQHP